MQGFGYVGAKGRSGYLRQPLERMRTCAPQTWTLTHHQQNYDNFMAQIKNVLSSVNTVNQLKTAWPECVKYLPSECLVKEKQLPVDSVTVLSINSKLGLLPNAHPANSN